MTPVTGEAEDRAAAWVAESWLPRRPLATDDLQTGVYRMSRPQALTRRLVEHSPQALQAMLVVDVDHPDALVRALGLPRSHPEPSWIAETPATGRGHVGWVLRSPVCRTDAGRPGAILLAARCEEGLRRSLDGDVGYAGLLTKNPTHPSWHVTWARSEPYDLAELAAGLVEGLGALPRLSRRPEDRAGLGRNVDLFDVVRKWAYGARRRYVVAQEWHEVVHAKAADRNALFAVPLGAGEVRDVAKSVASWVWRRPEFTEAGFRAEQARRGRNGAAKGASKGGRANTLAQQAARRRTKIDYSTIAEGLR